MDDGIKYIFKTLVKVPIIIIVCYFFLNLFTFASAYLRMQGASNTVQRVVMDYNYLTQSDIETLNEYLASIDEKSQYLNNVKLVINTDNAFQQDNVDSYNVNDRKQYGVAVACGVTAKYTPVLPLITTYGDMLESGEVEGYGEGSNTGEQAGGGFKDFAVIEEEARRREAAAAANNNMTFVNTVIGMQYYSDLD